MNLLVAVAREVAGVGFTGEIVLQALPQSAGGRLLLQQVWINLLSNAVKYSRHTVAPRIQICGEMIDTECVHHVHDNGVGRNMQYADTLFGVFRRLHSDEFPCTGIGLAIVWRVVTRHGARVWAAAHPGAGACFHFALPHPKELSMQDLTPVKVLLVEDNPVDAELTIKTLHADGLCNEIDWVKDGAEALDYLYSRNTYAGKNPYMPRLVLLDLKLPKLDGLEVLRIIKQDPALQPLPVVILTSSAEEIDLVRSYNLGANGYVVKPVDFDAFTSEVSKLGFFWLLTNRSPMQ